MKTSQPAPILQLEPGIASGFPITPGWESIVTYPLLILVGATAVGKNTTTAALQKVGLTLTLLPNRRVLTDRLILTTMLLAEGYSPIGEDRVAALDRLERLAYARRYREQFPGGMAHVLSQLQVDPQQVRPLLMFDGLRGEAEVRYATEHLPHARFVVLEAPDRIRLQRMLGRQDPFDRVAPVAAMTEQLQSDHLDSFASLGTPSASAIFSPAEEQEMLDWVRQGRVTPTELSSKLKIIVAERQNYDPIVTRQVLQEIAPARTLVIDTVGQTPAQSAQQIYAWL